MNVRIALLSIAIAACLPCAASAAGAGVDKFRTVDRPIPGEYIVVLKDEPAPFAGKGPLQVKPVANEAARLAASHRFTVDRVYSHALRGFAIRADDAALAKLLADPSVEYVEENAVFVQETTQSSPMWGLDRIDQTSLPLSGGFTYTRTGTGVHVYVMDGPINTGNVEFSGRVGNGVNKSGDTTTCTTNSHGSNVAGIILGTTYGVAKKATLHNVQVLKCDGTGGGTSLIDGLDWVLANRTNPAVVNMSLSSTASTTYDNAVQKLIDAGIVVVVAAGNQNTDACTRTPARVAGAITVAATINTDARWAGSNYGTCVDIFAPGGGIKSAGIGASTATSTYSGTSQAAPHVAGAAAMYIDLWNDSQTTPASPSRVHTAITNNSTAGKVTSPGTGSPNRLLNTTRF